MFETWQVQVPNPLKTRGQVPEPAKNWVFWKLPGPKVLEPRWVQVSKFCMEPGWVQVSKFWNLGGFRFQSFGTWMGPGFKVLLGTQVGPGLGLR